MKKFLFITWDGPQVNYLEGLFYPIFDVIRKQLDIEFHIIQFTWGNHKKINYLQELSEQLGFKYTSVIINRKPHPIIGVYYTAYKGCKLINKYIIENNIDIIMPRSNLPAMMINRIKNIKAKIIFDADGLPLEERVDFSGLKKSSLQYRLLKRQETLMLKKANAVLTRSQKAIEIHLNNIGKEYLSKFFVVTNGRNPDFFHPNDSIRKEYRKKLGINENAIVFVYCGSLGSQYAPEEMIEIFVRYKSIDSFAKFLILTGSPGYIQDMIPEKIRKDVIVRSASFEEVPDYLNIADIAFAIRKPTYSMQGVAPIKLGEYLLMGLPTIASKGIGDTENILQNNAACFLYDHNDNHRMENAIKWCIKAQKFNPDKIRDFGIANFSLQKSAEDYIKAINYI